MPRISKAPEERRQELVDAARDLFQTQGYEKTMVSDIVKQVGVAQGLFYYYFPSKKDVFLAVIEQFVTAHIAELAVRLGDTSIPILGRIRNLLQVLANFLGKVNLLYPNRQGMNAEIYPIVHDRVMEMMEPLVTEVLIEGTEQGVLSAPYPRRMARFLLTGFMGIESMEDTPDPDEMMALVLQMLERLLLVPKQALQSMTQGGESLGEY